MTPSAACVALIKRFEGCKLDAYLDAVGVPTIGYGHTKGVFMGDRITEAQADAYLHEDIEEHAKGILPLLLVPVTQGQFDALVSFAFNLGVGALKRSTLLRRVNDGDKFGASEEFHKWVFAKGQKLAGLVARRRAEAQLFLS